MSYYRTVTIYHVPERKKEGVAMLKTLSQLLNTYGAATHILTNSGGEDVCIHVVSHFETVAQFEALNAWAAMDATYQAWLQSVQDLFDWSRTQTNLYRIVE